MKLNFSQSKKVFIGAVLAAIVSLPVLGYINHQHLPAKILQRHWNKGFTVCFDVEHPHPPNPTVLARLPAIKAKVDAMKARWPSGMGNGKLLLALAFHESGLNPEAISPTGCAGLLAYARPFDATPACCAKDPKDNYNYEYDLCNSERELGYRCSYEQDRRFQVDETLNHGFSDLESLSSSIEAAPAKAQIDLLAALAIFWNAGKETTPNFPASLTSADSMIRQISFQHVEPYRHWSLHALANKLVEIFDYVLWLNFLETTIVSQEETRAAFSSMPSGAVTACIAYNPDASNRLEANELTFKTGMSALIPKLFFSKIRIKRLRYGNYEDGTAWIKLGVS